jgi:hypothetical protein
MTDQLRLLILAEDAKGAGGAQGLLFGIPADAVAKEPLRLTPAQRMELFPGIRPGESVAAYEKRMGTTDTPVMFAPRDADVEIDTSTANVDADVLRKQAELHLDDLRKSMPGGVVNEPTGRRIKFSRSGNVEHGRCSTRGDCHAGRGRVACRQAGIDCDADQRPEDKGIS